MRSCPICLHNESEVVYIQKFAEHFKHKIVQCLLCGFAFVGNTPSQKYYDEYYKKQSKYEGTRQHEMHDKFTYAILEKILTKYISKNAKILEVGCSTGKLLHFIKTKGFKNVKGIEPAPKCRAIAKKLYDVEVVTSTFANFKTTDRFDMIIFSEVLEHLIDVRDVILKVRSLLNENGMVYIGVPDAERFYKKFSEPFGEFSTEHINFFTYKSLSQLLSTYQNILVKSDSRTLLTLWKKEEETLNRMNTYIQKSQKNMDSVMQTIRSLPKQTIVWGVGALTQRLLKSTRLAKKVFLFVDSNKNIVGKKIDGILVISPNDLYKHSNPLLISSFGFKDEIFQEIKKRKLKNKIITFK